MTSDEPRRSPDRASRQPWPDLLPGRLGGARAFPDFHSRLHALTKADNLGLGLIALGVAFQIAEPFGIVKLALVWLLAVLAAASVAQLIARSALDRLPDEGPVDKGG
jgi:multicomponent Na+:H+ antiporter subunit G